jgi:alpha-D-xyloside xylohydrolase
VTSVDRSLRRLLGPPRQLELVSGGPTGGTLPTSVVDLEDRPAYGTTAEVPRTAPLPGPGMTFELTHLTTNASRFRLGRMLPTPQPSLFLDTAARADEGPLTVNGDGRLTAGSLRSRTMHLESLTRSVSAWPLHEQQWQVMHRLAHPLGAAVAPAGPWFASFDLAHDEQVFGFGEDFGPLGKRGTSQRLWMEEAWNNSSPSRYKPIPFFWSTAGWGILVHTTNAVRVEVGALDHTAITIVIDDTDHLDLVVMVGDTPRDLIAEYHRLTGAARVPPQWTFGTWQGRISYRSQDEVLQVARTLRERRLPCDVIHIDTDWFSNDWACDYRFSPDRFPDPEAMLAELRSMGLRTCLWQWPNAMRGTSTFDAGAAEGWLARDRNDQVHLQPGFVEPAGTIDYSNPDAVEWIAQQIAPLIDIGVAAIKTDFGEGAPTDATYHGVEGRAAHNAYPLLYNRAMMAAIDAVTDDGVVWSRSAWAGSQRFPIHWSGDGFARFGDLACVVRSMLSMGLSGIPFYAHDVGGFSGVPDAELLVRWTQLGVMSSHLRFHGFPPREPWEFGDEAERIIRRWLDLRYQLLPYLWHTASQAATESLPMCRAMVVAFPADRNCRDLDDQYLLGDHLLCAPILDDRGERKVYFPDDGWIDWFTDTPMVAGWQRVHTTLDTAPLYRRADVQIPLARAGAQHTGEVVPL